MAARRYEIPLRVLNNFASERSEQVKYFSAREENFVSASGHKHPTFFTLLVFAVKGVIYYMLFSHVKTSCFRAKADLVFYWCIYNKMLYFTVYR